MSLINCPECQHTVSDKAAACPNCGFGVKDYIEEQNRLVALQEEYNK